MDGETIDREHWKLATTTSGADLRRILEMYRELGIEVQTEEVSPEECGDCRVCFVAGDETLYRIYTRAGDEAGGLI